MVQRFCAFQVVVDYDEKRHALVMELFYHASSKIDGLFYDDGDKKMHLSVRMSTQK